MENRIISSQTAANVVEIMRLTMELNPEGTPNWEVDGVPTVLVGFNGYHCALSVTIYLYGSELVGGDYNWPDILLHIDSAESTTTKIIEILKNLLKEKSYAK